MKNQNIFKRRFEVKNKHLSELGNLIDDFTKAYDQPLDVSIDSSASLLGMRHRLIKEEYNELTAVLSAAEYNVVSGRGISIADQEAILKEACDLVYVLIGLCRTYGWDFDKAFAEVHRSNMSKLGEDGKPIKRDDGKVLKGPNYKTAFLADCI